MKHEIDPIWRKPHEAIAAIGWLIAGGVMWLIGSHGAELQGIVKALACISILFAGARAAQVVWLWEKKARLVQSGEFTLSGDQIMKVVNAARKKAKKGKLRIDY